MAWACLAASLLGIAVWVRHLFIEQAAPLRVDHYYWLLAADAFRGARRLPAETDGRYLLEPRAQAYPPFFGWLLSKLPRRWLTSSASVWLCQAADAAAIAIATVLGVSLGLGWAGALALLVTVLFAPTLVAYNTQLNPRSVGNLFLVLQLAAEVASASATGSASWGWAGVAIASAAALWLSHKMATQLMLALWLPWAVALGTPLAWIAPLVGLLLAGVVAGPGPLLYQLAAHLDIVRFWSRHWPSLGLYTIRQSPIYGEGTSDRSAAVHKPGLKGVIAHVRLIAGYAPILVLLPVLLMLGPPMPAWLVVWALGTLTWALATALLPALKGLGAGSLYVFFGVIPAGLWIALAVETGDMLAIAAFVTAATASAASLALGWRQRQGRRTIVEDGYGRLIERLRQGGPERVAVFPVTSADAIAGETPHRVLWGAHGYAFDLLEPIFPLIVRPLSETFARYRITRLVWSETWWPEAGERLAREMRLEGIETFGRWRTAAVSGLPAPPPITVCRLVRTSAGHAQDASASREATRELPTVTTTTLPVGGVGPLSLYRRLRALQPDIADCRDAGMSALVVANLAGVPHRLVAPPATWLEHRLVDGGLGSVAVPAEETGAALHSLYARCASGDVATLGA